MRIVLTVIQKCNFNRSLEKVNVTILLLCQKKQEKNRNETKTNNHNIVLHIANEYTNIVICRAN